MARVSEWTPSRPEEILEFQRRPECWEWPNPQGALPRDPKQPTFTDARHCTLEPPGHTEVPPENKRLPLLARHLKGHQRNDSKLPYQFSKQHLKEPLHPHSVPSFPWQKLATDLLDYKRAQYLLVTDCYSKYPILRKLNSTKSAALINHLKSIFAEHGITEILISDNGPQYSSHKFTSFCNH